MKKAEKIKKLYIELAEEEDQDYAIDVWYRSLPKEILGRLETPCWGIEIVEKHYGINL